MGKTGLEHQHFQVSFRADGIQRCQNKGGLPDIIHLSLILREIKGFLQTAQPVGRCGQRGQSGKAFRSVPADKFVRIKSVREIQNPGGNAFFLQNIKPAENGMLSG